MSLAETSQVNPEGTGVRHCPSQWVSEEGLVVLGGS
jgi:hypothetical protein